VLVPLLLRCAAWRFQALVPFASMWWPGGVYSACEVCELAAWEYVATLCASVPLFAPVTPSTVCLRFGFGCVAKGVDETNAADCLLLRCK
jgi:hypothetical protein